MRSDRKKALSTLLCMLLCMQAVCGIGEAANVFSGVGQGNNGDIKVSVTYENSVITGVEVLEHAETPGLSDPAIEQIPSAIVAANGTEVDIISGVTNTCNGIIAAVNDALVQAGCEVEVDTSTVFFGKDYAQYTPRVTTLDNGIRVQKTPDSGYPWGVFNSDPNFVYYNTYFLNADNRGCSSCHDLEQCLRNLGHEVYNDEYDTGSMPVQNCAACHNHTYSGNLLQDPIHGLHMGRKSFQNMGGSCESCHYIDAENNYHRWDYVKYDVLHGIVDLPADAVNVAIEWNQDELTADEDMFTLEWSASNYGFDYVDAYRTDNVRDTYKVQFVGDMANPCELSINEMIEMFGSETRVICGQCIINGNGGSLIYQREVTGIPLNKILDYLGLGETSNCCVLTGLDGYTYAGTVETIRGINGLLVYEMEGEELTNAQGYPIAFWCENQSCGAFVRNLVNATFYQDDPINYEYGDYTDWRDPVSGRLINKPNMCVLKNESGTIFAPGETVHLEGYANAFGEPITKIEFSFDRGATWKEISTEGSASERWVYWKMDIADLAPGSYVLTMRATSQKADGSSRTMEELPKFLINVK